MKTLLCLDASTKAVGISVLECEGNTISLIHWEVFQPNKKDNIFDKLFKTRAHIVKLIDKFKPDELVLEDIIKFMPGKSTATTITTLACFNRSMGLLALEKLNKQPCLMNVMTIRHAIKENKIIPKKEDIPELVAKILKISFPYLYIINKKTKIKEINPISNDLADSIAAGIAYWIKQSTPKKIKKSKNGNTRSKKNT